MFKINFRNIFGALDIELALPLRNSGEKQARWFPIPCVIQIIIYDNILHYSIDDHRHPTVCSGVNILSHNFKGDNINITITFLNDLYRSTLLPFRMLTHLQKSWPNIDKAGPIRYYIIFVAPFQRFRSNRLLRRTNSCFWDNSQNCKQMSKTLATFRFFTNLAGGWLHSWICVVNQFEHFFQVLQY